MRINDEQQTRDARLVRVEEAAVSLGVSPSTIRRWCSAGFLEGVTLPRGGLRIRARSLAALMQGEETR